MTANSQHWIVTLGSRRGRLIKAEPVPAGRWRTEQVDEITNQWEDYHEHGRPEGLSKGRGTLAKSEGYSFAAGSHDDAEMQRRFARDVVKWLGDQIGRRSIETIDLFAPPSFLGDLRAAIPARLSGRIREHQAQLNSIDVNELTNHSAITPLFNGR
jgi:protein required for attachment to host cells